MEGRKLVGDIYKLNLIAAYCASKAAVISMTKSDAIDVRVLFLPLPKLT
jgi:hypothetical protein